MRILIYGEKGKLTVLFGSLETQFLTFFRGFTMHSLQKVDRNVAGRRRV